MTDETASRVRLALDSVRHVHARRFAGDLADALAEQFPEVDRADLAAADDIALQESGWTPQTPDAEPTWMECFVAHVKTRRSDN